MFNFRSYVMNSRTGSCLFVSPGFACPLLTRTLVVCNMLRIPGLQAANMGGFDALDPIGIMTYRLKVPCTAFHEAQPRTLSLGGPH